jgi:hypothetical protein
MSATWDRKHGTTAAYYAGCRCDDCRKAKRLKVAADRARARERGFANLSHGSTSAYDAGCRCRLCLGHRQRRHRRDARTTSPVARCRVCRRDMARIGGGRFVILHGPPEARCPGSHYRPASAVAV